MRCGLRFGSFQVTVSVVFTVVMVAGAHAEIKHFGISDVTQFVTCAEKTLQKHVVLHPNLPLKQLVPLCSHQPRDEFVAAMQSQSVAVKEDAKWAYLLPASYFGPWQTYTPEGQKLRWKNFKVEISIVNADLKLHQTEMELKPEELARLKDQVLEQARLIRRFEP